MRVLVLTASKHGATEEIGGVIAERLSERGFEVDRRQAGESIELIGVDAAIIGSAVYMGHWMSEARDAVRAMEPALAGKPVWLFSSGPIGDPPAPDPDTINVDELVAALGAREHRVFAGALDRHKLGFAEKLAVKFVKAPEGDFRDWAAIRDWADEIATELKAVRVSPGAVKAET